MHLKARSILFHSVYIANSTFSFLSFKKLYEVKVERAETDATGALQAAGQFEHLLASASGVKLTRPI